jgi:hypothetical protein
MPKKYSFPSHRLSLDHTLDFEEYDVISESFHAFALVPKRVVWFSYSLWLHV